MACVATWSKEDVANWLEQCLQLPYARLFKELDIDGPTLIELNDEKLSALGITESTHLLRLLSHIAVFRSQLGRSLLVVEDPLKNEYGNDFHTNEVSSTPSEPVQNAEPVVAEQDLCEIEEQTFHEPIVQQNKPLEICVTGVSGASRRSQSSSPCRKRTARHTAPPIIMHQRNSAAARAQTGSPRNSSVQGRKQVMASSSRNPAPATPRMPKKALTQPAVQPYPITYASHDCQHDSQRRSPSGMRNNRQSFGLSKPKGANLQTAQWSPVMQQQHHAVEGGRTPRARSNNRNADKPSSTDNQTGFPCKTSNPVVDVAELVDKVQQFKPYLATVVPHQCQTPSTAQDEAISRSQGASSKSSSRKHVANSSSSILSEFGHDKNRGAPVYTAPRSSFPPGDGPGPGSYASPGSTMERRGVAKFPRDPRRTMEVMQARGKESPGSGTYNPPPRNVACGVRFGSAARWKSEGTRRKKPDPSPGPQSYMPKHHYLSSFR